eukprot:scaffold31088_cov110-Skeletonema_marinoi.AAC.2
MGWARACSCHFQRLFPLTFCERGISTAGALGNNIKSWRTISNPLYEIIRKKVSCPTSMRSDVRQERGKVLHVTSA